MGGLTLVFLQLLRDVNRRVPVLAYETISALQATEPVPPNTPESLTRIYFYMDDVISVVQGRAD